MIKIDKYQPVCYWMLYFETKSAEEAVHKLETLKKEQPGKVQDALEKAQSLMKSYMLRK